MGVALSRAEVASGSFCWANSFLNAATLCSASASVAAVPRTCAMSSFKAVLSISISRLPRATTTGAPKIAEPEKVKQMLTIRIARDQSYPLADRAHGLLLRPACDCADGWGFGIELPTVFLRTEPMKLQHHSRNRIHPRWPHGRDARQ